MADKIDMSLDDIIKKNRGKFNSFRNRTGRNFRGRGNARANANVGRNRNVLRIKQTSIAKSKFAIKKGTLNNRNKPNFVSTNRTIARRGGINNLVRGPSKLVITNLDYGVSDSDIQELFSEFGTLRKAAIHYDQSGKSLGMADVIFERRIDATRAMNRYNGVPLDGRPMKIQISNFPQKLITNPGQRGGGLQNRFRGRGRGNRRGRGGFKRL